MAPVRSEFAEQLSVLIGWAYFAAGQSASGRKFC